MLRLEKGRYLFIMKSKFKGLILLLACVLFVILGVTFITSLQPKETYTYGELMTMLDEGKIEAFEIKTDGSVKFLVKKDDGTVTEVNYRLLAQSQMDTLLEKGEILKAEGKLKNYTTQEPSRSSGLLSWLPIILILVVLIGFWIYAMNQTTGKNGIDHRPKIDRRHAFDRIYVTEQQARQSNPKGKFITACHELLGKESDPFEKISQKDDQNHRQNRLDGI